MLGVYFFLLLFFFFFSCEARAKGLLIPVDFETKIVVWC